MRMYALKPVTFHFYFQNKEVSWMVTISTKCDSFNVITKVEVDVLLL